MSLRPLIAICGTTGVGKSKLAIELALALSQRYSGARIINADAMQVYAGMDIITNKVPHEEQCGVDHLLMGFKSPGEQYVVGQWVKDAMRLINETHQRNQIPIVVGGTSYWIQHLVFPGRLGVFDETTSEVPATPSTNSKMSENLIRAISALPQELHTLYDNLPEQPPLASEDPDAASTLHRLLTQLDPIVAQRWHWKDTRKVMRSLKIIKESGKLSSEIILEQSETEPPPRYRTLFLWLYARPEKLDPRLDARVDVMLEQGLLREVDELIREAAAAKQVDEARFATSSDYYNSAPIDYTLGMYQSIGYREFSSYLIEYQNLSPSLEDKPFATAVERMKLSTRQYARKQVKWIRNKLLPAVYAANLNSNQGENQPREIVSAYLLDATELGEQWSSEVEQPALEITRRFLQGSTLPVPITLSSTAKEMLTIAQKPINPEAILEARRRIVCHTCTTDESKPVMIEQGKEWEAHARTKRHRTAVARAKKQLTGPPGDK
ncbi:tRNA isopentenyltransferase [Irpex rosettiformis]|uniref:tRNA isopentenyltransferase n=1 Tax=Irpex rosettiformis TaxID=378272 RepID=A0ACB8U2C0_9APHY|nr:tRNA isopentenyltransferase [Irpex rosettiformis]